VPSTRPLAENAQRKARPLTMPVLAIGGQASYGERVAGAMAPIAGNVQGAVIPGAGHWVAEEAPDEMLAALTAFLAPYRAGADPGSVARCRVTLDVPTKFDQPLRGTWTAPEDRLAGR
jgi:hypothetical protein